MSFHLSASKDEQGNTFCGLLPTGEQLDRLYGRKRELSPMVGMSKQDRGSLRRDHACTSRFRETGERQRGEDARTELPLGCYYYSTSLLAHSTAPI